jgi:hypothetical protein
MWVTVKALKGFRLDETDRLDARARVLRALKHGDYLVMISCYF